MPRRITNPGLAALISGAGFASLDSFAAAINDHGWRARGVRLAYDHISVTRWLAGGRCQNPDTVAAVLTTAWGIPIPAEVIWPDLRDGAPAGPAHLQPWVAARTLEALGAFIGADMLTRRDILAHAVTMTTGPAFTNPIARWLATTPTGLPATADQQPQRIGLADVAAIERCADHFADLDATTGGGLSREAAAGQLKFAVDLARHASYRTAVGERLLATIARLAGVVGWMCHDAGMSGPAQRYLTFALQAARESSAAQSRLLVIGLLTDLARHMRWAGRPDSALRLLALALDQLPADNRDGHAARAVLWSNKAWELASLGPAAVPEARNALDLAFDCQSRASGEDKLATGRLLHIIAGPDATDRELSSTAAAAALTIAEHDRRHVPLARHHAERSIATYHSGSERSALLNHIRLARVHFLAGEPEQATATALPCLAETHTAHDSTMVKVRLRNLHHDATAYRQLPEVGELRDGLMLRIGRTDRAGG